jgi:hypothetical protein
MACSGTAGSGGGRSHACYCRALASVRCCWIGSRGVRAPGGVGQRAQPAAVRMVSGSQRSGAEFDVFGSLPGCLGRRSPLGLVAVAALRHAGGRWNLCGARTSGCSKHRRSKCRTQRHSKRREQRRTQPRPYRRSGQPGSPPRRACIGGGVGRVGHRVLAEPLDCSRAVDRRRRILVGTATPARRPGCTNAVGARRDADAGLVDSLRGFDCCRAMVMAGMIDPWQPGR